MRPATEDKTTAEKAERLARRFAELYGAEAKIFRAPGRVNLIGEHTDYNEGFVMPAAIGMYAWVAAGPGDGRKLRVYSEHFGEQIEFDLGRLEGRPRKHWSDYVRGVAAVLERAGHHLRATNLVIDGDVPLGAGLGSSAALEVATALALTEIAGIQAPRLELAKLCQQAENEYCGARCGIMDQFISCMGRAGDAVMLDCRSLAYKRVPVPANVRIVVCNTMVKHDIAGGEYNARRAACEGAVEALRRFVPGIRALRDVTREQLEQHRAALDAIEYRRARHVVRENGRVQDGAEAMRCTQ